MSKPVEIEFLMKDGISANLDKIKAETTALSNKATLTSAEYQKVQQTMLNLRSSIAILEQGLNELRMVGETASPDLNQTENISQIEALEKHIKELEAELKRLQAVSEKIDVVPPELPNAEKRFNGLHNSIQQMAREMPSLAMGPQMFFMAISNNLPIFADEVARARKEYDDLIKTGQKGTPVWKQILSSLFSWQTALTTGIMLLVMYGDEIIEWTKDIFSAKKGVEEFTISLEEMTEIEKDGRAQMIRTRFELDTLATSLKNFTGTKEEEKAKVEELNRKYGEAFGYYDTLAQWYDIIIQKGEDYIQILFLQAKAQALVSKAVEADEELQKIKKQKPGDADSDMNWFAQMGHYMMQTEMAQAGQYYDAQGTIDKYNKEAHEEAVRNAEARVNGYLDEAAELEAQAAKIGQNFNIGNHTRPTTPTTVDPQREAELRLQAEAEVGERLLDLQRKNQQDDINLRNEGLAKKLAQIEYDYETRKAEIEKQATELAALNKKAGGEENLTEEQQTEIDRANTNNEKERQQSIALAYQAEFTAMQEHLKEYGTFQQQKLAIAQEYAEKIRNATTEGERLSLGIERDSSLARIEAQELKANINWSAVFGEFGSMFSDMITPVLADAKKYMATDEFMNADHASQEALIAAVQQMEQSLGSSDRVSFKKLGSEIDAYQRALANLKEAQIEYGERYAELITAQSAYITAMQSGTAEEQAAAKIALETAQANAESVATNIETLQSAASAAQQTMTQTATTLKTSMDGVVSGLQKIASGSISGAYNGLIELGNNAEKIGGKLGEAFGKVADKLESVPIIGWIVSIIDIFKDGLSVVVGGILDAVFNAVSGIIGDILSGDLFKTIGESLLQGIGKIFDSLTWGGFSSWFGSGESDETLHEDIDRLTTSNENLRDAIDNLADKMENSSVADAANMYEHQKGLLEQQMANTQEMMRRSGAAYSNGFLGIGGDHSSNYEINEAMSSADWKRISDIVGRPINSAGDFWGLSSEEMAKVATEATDLYSKIEALADDGHENAAQYMDEYIEYYKQLEELQEAYYEKVTGMSFDTVRGNFKNMLLDMEADASSISEDIGETLLEGIVEGLMSDKYNDKMREWYTAFAEAMADDGVLDKDEAEDLREWYQRIMNEAIAERDAMLEAAGIDDIASGGTSQTGKSGSFSAMSQEQGTKLEGLFVSGQMHWASLDERTEDISESMSAAESHLAKIEENTEACAKELKEIKEEVKKQNRDGIKVK